MQETGPGALEGARDWRRTVLAAAPWVLAAGLAVLGALHVGDPPRVDAAPGPVPTATPPPPVATPRDPPGATSGEVRLPPDVTLAVLAAARRTLGTAGLVASGPAADSWPVEVRIAHVDAVSEAFAVATVHGLVIESAPGGWRGPRPRAVAVPLRTMPSPAVIGDAWPLRPPATATAAPSPRPVPEGDPGVLAPLEAAGWRVEEVTAVSLIGDALLRIELRGVPPSGSAVDAHAVWLLDKPAGPQLLPTQPHQEPEEPA